jgi:hypothetical protein
MIEAKQLFRNAISGFNDQRSVSAISDCNSDVATATSGGGPLFLYMKTSVTWFDDAYQ